MDEPPHASSEDDPTRPLRIGQVPRWRDAAAGLLFIGLAVAWLIPAVGFEPEALHRLFAGWEELYGPAAVTVTELALRGLPVLLLLLWGAHRLRRVLSVTLTDEWLRVELTPWRTLRAVTPAADITEWRVDAGRGVHVRTRDAVHGPALLTIPATRPGEVAGIVQRLEAAAMPRATPCVGFGAPEGRSSLAVKVLLRIAIMLAGALVGAHIARRGGPGALGMVLAIVLPMLGVVVALLLAPRDAYVWRRVQVGAHSLVVGDLAAPYGALRAVAVAGGRVAVEADGGERSLAALRPDDAARARALLAERLGPAGGPPLGDALPAWASRRAQWGRIARAVALPLGLGLSMAVLLAVAPDDLVVSLEDPLGQRLLLVRGGPASRRPRAAVLDGRDAVGSVAVVVGSPWSRTWRDATAPRDREVVVDLAAGEVRWPGGGTTALPPGATFVHLTGEREVRACAATWLPRARELAGGSATEHVINELLLTLRAIASVESLPFGEEDLVVLSARSVPDWLGSWADPAAPAPLRDAVEGRTTRRRLTPWSTWRGQGSVTLTIDRGEVALVVEERPLRGIRIDRPWLARGDSKGTKLPADQRLVHVAADGAVWSSPGPAPPPRAIDEALHGFSRGAPAAAVAAWLRARTTGWRLVAPAPPAAAADPGR